MATGTVHETEPRKHGIAILPTTRPGWWAVGLAVAAVALVLSTALAGAGGGLSFASGLAGGIVALVAIFRHRERALTVFLAVVVPPVQVVLFVLAELLGYA
jgi:hypothetical protein